jgi:hypothetical protein
MSEAIKLIVDGYFSLKDRKSLEALREHRLSLKKQLLDQPRGWVDVRRSTELFDEDLRAIEAALTRL